MATVTDRAQRHHLDSLLAANPGVDAAVVREGMRFVKQLRESGVEDHTYNLGSPYGRAIHGADEGTWSVAVRR